MTANFFLQVAGYRLQEYVTRICANVKNNIGTEDFLMAHLTPVWPQKAWDDILVPATVQNL